MWEFLFSYYFINLVQLHEFKIILGAVGTFVIELEHAHVLLLNLYGPIIERVWGMLAGGNSSNHIWGQYRSVRTFDTFWCYAKYSTHRLLVYYSFAKIHNKIELLVKYTNFLVFFNIQSHQFFILCSK